MTEEEFKDTLLTLARYTLENKLLDSGHNLERFNLPELQEERGLFVTLHLDDKLRGCIGRLEAHKSIYRNVIELSKAAAFEDHRFRPLTPKELPKVKIEISLLTTSEKVEGVSNYEKIMKIRPKKDGVILVAQNRNATFLPQVWESVPIREDFISELCRKAGLPSDYWEYGDIELSTYQVKYFEES